MVFLIFDTNMGLCNQFYDIISGINFCLIHNIFFTFRNCVFRSDDLVTWQEEPFEKLFDLMFLNECKLYVNYYNIKDKLTCDNCFNLNDNLLAYVTFNNNNILDQLINLNKEYIVLKQFWSLYNFQQIIDNTIKCHIRPSKEIMEKYIEIKNTIIKDEPYNYIHYRYEKDFTDYFKIEVDTLDKTIENIKFKNSNLKIYIATSNIKSLLKLNDSKYINLIYKNDDVLMDLNFEQRAFIDYMFGLNSEECYGHAASSFSHMLNDIKKTNNYYG
jgi:hypothetical protein